MPLIQHFFLTVLKRVHPFPLRQNIIGIDPFARAIFLVFCQENGFFRTRQVEFSLCIVVFGLKNDKSGHCFIQISRFRVKANARIEDLNALIFHDRPRITRGRFAAVFVGIVAHHRFVTSFRRFHFRRFWRAFFRRLSVSR